MKSKNNFSRIFCIICAILLVLNQNVYAKKKETIKIPDSKVVVKAPEHIELQLGKDHYVYGDDIDITAILKTNLKAKSQLEGEIQFFVKHQDDWNLIGKSDVKNGEAKLEKYSTMQLVQEQCKGDYQKNYDICAKWVAQGEKEICGTTILTIEPKEISDPSVEVATMSAVIYDGYQKQPVPVIKDGDYTLKHGKEFQLSYKDNVEPGTATVKIQGIGAYQGEIMQYFDIIKDTKVPENGKEEEDPIIKLKENKQEKDIVTAELTLVASVNTQGEGKLTVTPGFVADAIRKAKQELQKEENKKGIAVAVSVRANAKSLEVDFPKTVIQELVDANVRKLEIDGLGNDVDLNTEALQSIQAQERDGIALKESSIQTNTKLQKEVIGNHYSGHFALIDTKKGSSIQKNLNRGSVVLYVPYTLKKGETAAGICAVTMDDGIPQKIDAATYDATNKILSIPMDENEVYGIAYQKTEKALLKEIKGTKKQVSLSSKNGSEHAEKLQVTLPKTMHQVQKYGVEKSNLITEAKISYESVNPKVASVSKNGVVTAKKAGTTKVRTIVQLRNGEKKTYTTVVTVNK